MNNYDQLLAKIVKPYMEVIDSALSYMFIEERTIITINLSARDINMPSNIAPYVFEYFSFLYPTLTFTIENELVSVEMKKPNTE